MKKEKKGIPNQTCRLSIAYAVYTNINVSVQALPATHLVGVCCSSSCPAHKSLVLQLPGEITGKVPAPNPAPVILSLVIFNF